MHACSQKMQNIFIVVNYKKYCFHKSREKGILDENNSKEISQPAQLIRHKILGSMYVQTHFLDFKP